MRESSQNSPHDDSSINQKNSYLVQYKLYSFLKKLLQPTNTQVPMGCTRGCSAIMELVISAYFWMIQCWKSLICNKTFYHNCNNLQ